MGSLNLADLSRVATDFRAAIELSRAEKATPHVPYFPDGACRLVSRLLALHLRRRGADNAIAIVSGHMPGLSEHARHVWLVVDGAIVDLTADAFGEAAVVVGAPTRFHRSLDELEEVKAETAIAAFTPDEAARCQRLLGTIEACLLRVSHESH